MVDCLVILNNFSVVVANPKALASLASTHLDCEQSVFFSQIHGEKIKKKKERKRDCERYVRAAIPQTGFLRN